MGVRWAEMDDGWRWTMGDSDGACCAVEEMDESIDGIEVAWPCGESGIGSEILQMCGTVSVTGKDGEGGPAQWHVGVAVQWANAPSCALCCVDFTTA